MGPPEFIVAIVFGSILGMYLIGKIFGLIKYWIENKNDQNNRLANDEDFLEALREFKLKTDLRLSNIEAVLVADEASNEELKTTSKNKSIQIDQDSATWKKEEKQDRSSGSKLKNMLNK